VGYCVPVGRVPHAGQVKGDDPDDCSLGWGLGARPSASSCKKLTSIRPQRHLDWDGDGDREEWRRLLMEARAQMGP
jgi:hypothetical protein